MPALKQVDRVPAQWLQPPFGHEGPVLVIEPSLIVAK
jgi:hypothetical protein